MARIARSAFGACLLSFAIGVACTSIAASETVGGQRPSGSALSISRDEQDVYEAVLASWFGEEQGRQLVNEELGPPPSTSDPEFSECVKGFNFPANANEGSRKTLVGVQFARPGIELIDGSHWNAVDPGQGLAQGKSVESAVEQGMSHSLTSFSEVAFSQSGKDALVKFGMTCGRLCGTGSTLHLHKTRARWVVLNRCGGWIS